MTYYCKLCDKSMMNKSKYNHSKSIGHKILHESFIPRYIIQDRNINYIDEIMRKYINIYNKKYETFQ